MQRIVHVSSTPARLCVPKDSTEQETLRYGLCFPFQAGPTTAGIFCNLRREYAPTVDFEAGTDVILFDRLRDIPRVTPIQLARNHVEDHPGTGESWVMVKYPVTGGFVPLGAKRADGTPHPHAGTGFGRMYVWGQVPETALALSERRDMPGSDFAYTLLQQYRYDGTIFTITDERKLTRADMPAGLSLEAGFTGAIPDEDDLLFPMLGSVSGGICVSGVARWRRQDGKWWPVEFHPVPGTEATMEPSLVRDTDGSLLFCVRGNAPDTIHAVRIWRSTDLVHWELLLHEPSMIGRAPVTINSADGSPYVVGTPIDPSAPRETYQPRERLWIWPLERSRRSFRPPIVLHDAVNEFGYDAPGGDGWFIDHPAGFTVRLADREWHHLAGYRCMDRGEITRMAQPTPDTGAYLREVHTTGPVMAPWLFDM